jgi:hypothetical protein
MRETEAGEAGLASLTNKSLYQKEYGIMQQKLQMVEFGVAGLEEVRTLVTRWKKVLAGLGREEGPAMVWKTHRQVGIEVEDRRPGEEVPDLPGPQRCPGEVPGRPQAGEAGGLRRAPYTRGGYHLQAGGSGTSSRG